MPDSRLIPSSPQEADTYLKWHKFDMPYQNGTQAAVAVPKGVGVVITSLCTLLLEWIAINSYHVGLACWFAYFLHRHKRATTPVTSIWNKRWSLTDSILDLYFMIRKRRWEGVKLYLGVMSLFAVLAFQIALSVIVPKFLLLDSAAPANPNRVVILFTESDLSSDRVKEFQLRVPSALRAASIARAAPEELKKKVTITLPESLGETENGDQILQIKYSYTVSGTDMGLQTATSLLLSVTGACTTEYSWLVASTNSQGIDYNAYQFFNNPNPQYTYNFSAADSLVPVAFFVLDELTTEKPPRNVSWALGISSVGRFSYSEGKDPLYRTGPLLKNGSDGAPQYVVLPKRPILSCWEEDTWTYEGQEGSVSGLNNSDSELPTLFLPEPISDILLVEHMVPRIVTLGTQLTYSALQSSVTALGGIIDAESNSFLGDFQQLVLASYISTANALSESTLFPPTDDKGLSGGQRNLAVDEKNNPRDGAGKFVVFTSDVVTFRVAALTAVPVIALLVSALKTILLARPLKIVNALDAAVLHNTVISSYPKARPTAKSMDLWLLEGKRCRDEIAQEEGLLEKVRKGGGVRIEIRPVNPLDDS